MTLSGTHAKERAALEKLLEVLDKREPTFDSLKQAVNGAMGWGYPDPTPHLREALRHYLSEESNTELNQPRESAL